DIRAGGSTITLTLTDDSWAAAGAPFDAQRQNLINGLVSAGAEAAGWNNVVQAGLAVTDVVRTSNIVVTITLAAFPGYDITVTETITATVPASALAQSGGALVAAPTFDVLLVTATISSAANQNFTVGDPTTPIAPITITDDLSTPTITAANDIRIRIPAGFNMLWDAADLTATLGGAVGKVSTAVTYEDAGRTLVLNVTADFAAGEQIIVSGLSFTSFTAASAADNLELEVFNDAQVSNLDDKTIAVSTPLTVSSAANQVFNVGAPAATISLITVTDDGGTPTITAANDIRIRVPAGFNMTWDTADLAAALGGSAAGKVSGTVSYEDAGQTLVLDVTANFAAADQLTVAGLSFANFVAVSAVGNLELEVGNDGLVSATDDKTIQINAPVTISSAANQTFNQSDPPTAMSAITITDNSGAAAITAANDLRIRIPAFFNMTWDTSDLTAAIGGAAAAKVLATVTYEDGGQTLVLDVTADFAPSEQITVAGLSFANFAAASPVSNLELEINNDGAVTSTDDKTIEVLPVFPVLFVNKTLVGPTTALIGQNIDYTLQYGNSSPTMAASNAVLADTLPVGLEYVSAVPAPTVNGQILTWNLGTVLPGDTSSLNLTVRVANSVRDTVMVSNIATLEASNASANVSVSTVAELLGIMPDQLALEKTAEVLEVSIGETAPFAITVENTGQVAVSDIRVYDLLPEGGRLSEGSVIGVDSVQTDGRNVTFFIDGPLVPGETHSFRYVMAVLAADADVIENRAYATAENDFARSADVVEWVRVRRGFPMETRAAIGKVWVDVDGNGVQNAGEPGLSGVDIWTDDGEIATTDEDGKFSFRNIRPGRHAFRLDRASIPLGYRIGSVEDLVVEDAFGWTTPRINFAVVPVEASLEWAEIPLPVNWRLTARPVCKELRALSPDGEPVVVAEFETNSSDLKLVGNWGEIRDHLVALAQAPDICRVEIAGHADSRIIHGGDWRDNGELSGARAISVLQVFEWMGILGPKLSLGAYGDNELLTFGEDSLALQRNRRVELRFDGSALVEYEFELANPNAIPVTDVSIRFDPGADSAVVITADSLVMRQSHGNVSVPILRPQERIVVRGWSNSPADSMAAVVQGNIANPGWLVAAIHNPLEPASGEFIIWTAADTLPSPEHVAAGQAVVVVVRPTDIGWPEVTYPIPADWELVPGSSTLEATPIGDPEVRTDREGRTVLRWQFTDEPQGRVSAKVRPVDGFNYVEDIRLVALRTADERNLDRMRDSVSGPGVVIFGSEDGRVSPQDRLYIGVRGEPGSPVALWDGVVRIGEATLGADGVYDFVGVPLAAGPHRLRVSMENSWASERWDSITVHVAGPVAEFVVPNDPSALVADGRSTTEIRVRIVDRWRIPVVRPTYVTVEAEGVTLMGDEDPDTGGVQYLSDAAGWLTIQARSGRDVTRGMLRLIAGSVERELEVDVMANARPLMLTGVGRVGLGASPEAFGALTARGRLDNRTSVILSVDSRKLDAGLEDFGRSFDPLDEAQYPLLGDGSRVTTVGSSRYVFSARLERGFDWIQFGDVATGDFASGLELTTYRRSLTGGAARLTTGPVVWRGFGSLTNQRLRQQQVRGAGTSGPYILDAGVIRGTEQIAVEVRDLANPQRTVRRERLMRFIDYQIDYDAGTVLFKRPVPATDPTGNPVFIMVTYEATSGGEQQLVGGARASFGVGGAGGLDSLRIGVTGIYAEEAVGAFRLAGADLRLLRFGGIDIGGEVSYSETPDSNGLATSVRGSIDLFGSHVNIGAGWMRIGEGFGNPSNRGLIGGSEEISFTGAVRVGPTAVRFNHDDLRFDTQGVRRSRTTAGIVQSFGRYFQLDAGGTQDRFENGVSLDESRAGEVKFTIAPTSRFKLWGEGRRQFEYSGNLVRPDHVGGGLALQVTRNLSLEGRHRQVLLPGGAQSYSITNFGVRSNIGFGTTFWGSYQLAGAAGAQYNAAMIGLNNRMRVGALTFNTLFERRIGLDQATLDDPVRALPFLQAEEDYWSAGLGVEFIPESAPLRLTARGEYRDGEVLDTRLFTLGGEASFNRSLGVLSRQEFQQTERVVGVGTDLRRRLSSLWGLAWRPIDSDALNILTKFSWLEETNPLGGGVLAAPDGREMRLIGAAEMIWAPARFAELAGRYAVRRTLADRLYSDGTQQELESWADYVGARMSLDVASWITLRGEGRLLNERTSRTQMWDAAPSLAVSPIAGFEVEGGYRFGTLQDPDFTVRGGHGWFVTFSTRITERIFPTAVDFWRPRF
ncbi:MAG: hypothetical protein O7I93_03600, partial [Gemmatimonadetes bacterium]|nr:hypothetical protein [Gemmatimonadota bacterium]